MKGVCRFCGIPLVAENCAKGGRTPDGQQKRQPWCKACAAHRQRVYYAQNRERLRKAARQRYHDNAERLRIAEYRRRRKRHVEVLVQAARCRAKKRGLACTVVPSDIEPLPITCPRLGIPVGRHSNRWAEGSWTLDRIDNTKGYTPDNVQVVSRRANTLKGDATLQELVQMGQWAESYLAAQEVASGPDGAYDISVPMLPVWA